MDSKASFTGAGMSPFKNPFVRGMLYAQWAYWCMLGVCVWAQRHLPPGPVRTVLTLAPVVPGVLIVAVAIWQYRNCDEFIRFKILSAAATAAVITAIWTLAYSYLELIGFPRLSMMWVGNAGWLVFIVLMIHLMLSGHEKPVA